MAEFCESAGRLVHPFPSANTHPSGLCAESNAAVVRLGAITAAEPSSDARQLTLISRATR
jgi:hypothetical protein